MGFFLKRSLWKRRIRPQVDMVQCLVLGTLRRKKPQHQDFLLYGTVVFIQIPYHSWQAHGLTLPEEKQLANLPGKSQIFKR